MKVKLLKGMVVDKQPYRMGQEIEVADRTGQQLIANGTAEAVVVEAAPAPKKKTRRGK